jgi:hypothetical protein
METIEDKETDDKTPFFPGLFESENNGDLK